MTRDEAVMYARRKAAERYREPIETMWPHHFVAGLRRAGFAVVPVAPTDKMILSGAERECAFKDRDGFITARGQVGEAVAHSVYRTMIAAYEKEQGDG